jgi:hypothetical protein
VIRLGRRVARATRPLGWLPLLPLLTVILLVVIWRYRVATRARDRRIREFLRPAA